jgi:dTDP-4-amino-4,6-dideoxygalactose transaminase
MFVPSDQVSHVLNKLHSIKCLARTMFKEPMSSLSFFEAQEELIGVKKFTENLIHLPSHHFMEHEELERIAEVLNETA